MRKIRIKGFSIAILSIALFTGSCSEDILEEEPRGVFTPEFFKTEQGVQGGLTFLYENLRDIYGFAYFQNMTETGTDEYVAAESADNNFYDLDLVPGQGNLRPESGFSIGRPWGASWPAINTASGIIENAAAVGLDESLIAEAKFFRAFYYFLMVQTYGGVPLDLGSGELAFNQSAIRTSVRNTVPDVYTKAIIPDLMDAVDDLPDGQRITGAVTKNVARLYLAKAYLTYGWWLENPNGIPTYPDTPRTDPNGNGPAYYYQQAYNMAVAGIDNPGPYRLLDYFYDVHDGANDRNEEMMLYSDRTQESAIYNGAPVTGFGNTDDTNAAVWMATSNYTTISVDGVAAVQREAGQSYGRPWTRMAPPIGVFTETFTDKDIDSRYDGTFVSSYRGNWDKGGDTTPTITAANGIEIEPGDAVISFLDEYNPNVDYVNGGNIGGGEIPGRSDYVINLNEINRRFYPGLWKLGPYRTDNSGGLGEPNVGNTRPFPIAKYSEFYLVAAEAAVKGASGAYSAYDLVNVVRARAGMWRFDNGEQEERMEDNSAAMVAATPTAINIDYILDELSREYFGEGHRWLDLIRTQKWTEYASTYEIGGTDASDHNPTTITRQIEPYHYLRPIPQNQIDALQMTDAEKTAYQNPGY
mgnify:CR=1 FL=1